MQGRKRVDELQSCASYLEEIELWMETRDTRCERDTGWISGSEKF